MCYPLTSLVSHEYLNLCLTLNLFYVGAGPIHVSARGSRSVSFLNLSVIAVLFLALALVSSWA